MSIFDPADRARLMAYKEAKNQIVSAMHLLRQERRDSPAEPQIPYLKGAEGLRGRLFRSLTPSISPLIQAGCCEMATVKKLVADFFRGIEIKLDANTSVTKTESKRNRHTRFPSAATPNGYIEFEDPLQPESIEGPDGEPIQLVNKIYIQRELFMRVAATDTKPVDPSEVKRWTLKHLNPYPIKVLARTELGTGISQAYPLVDVLYALRYHPLREHILRLNADGFTYVTFGGMKIDVATVEMIAKEGSPVSARAVQAMLKKLDLEHPVAVRVYSHNSNILRTVYRASSLKSMLSLFLQSDGVAIPISGYRTPMRLATTVSALARAEGAENLFAIANKLHVRGIWPVNIAQLGLEVESLDAVGRLGQGYTAMFHLVRVPGLEQSRILMTNHKGSLLVCTGSRIMDLEQIYWKDEVVFVHVTPLERKPC
ncbi:hypothetical protein [Armatimonas sp.]|uniref:hypothetical protein n=1 Tax=Armatimonas sp. TaxID=1872638 RepID=UPI003751FA2A